MLFREEGGHRILVSCSNSKMIFLKVTMVSSRENCMIVGFRLYAYLKLRVYFGISDGERILAFCNPCFDKSTNEEGNYEVYQPLYERSLLSCIPHMIAGVEKNQSISTFLIKIFIEFGALLSIYA